MKSSSLSHAFVFCFMIFMFDVNGLIMMKLRGEYYKIENEKINSSTIHMYI